MGYSELLDRCSVPSLENRRLYLKLCHMFKIVNNLCYFPPEIVVQSPSLLHSSRPPLLHQPFSRTTAFANSFVLDTIRKWNCLPTELVNAPTLHSFRTSLCVFTCNQLVDVVTSSLVLFLQLVFGYILILALLFYVTIGLSINYYKKNSISQFI